MEVVPAQDRAARTPTTIGASLIPVINKLQDIIAPLGTELKKLPVPQVAVVGSQSSGKSSVLEALVGRDFLPRGCDICTRRPLVLMLEQRSVKDDDDRDWGEFRHLPGKRFYDFAKIRQEIQAETDREAGARKGVSDKQIRLKISSPHVLNMTLIDLPGITKVPVGDQPSDIEARIRRMILSYISQENCIILAVSPANSDLATSDALQLAREADPSGSRTIGVITKLDIMDRGTDARNFLLGRVVPLQLGYVGVVNRCQEDIDQHRTIREALALEERFFREHPVYNDLSERCGIQKLAKKINQILEQHIRIAIPNLKAELNSHMVAVEKDLWMYGQKAESKAEQGAILLDILTRYCEALTAMVDGKSEDILTKELSGGSRIHYIFQSIFVQRLKEVDPCENLLDEDIRMAIQNSTGPRNALFVPEVPFESLVRRQIAQLLDPSLQCLRFVHDELVKMSRACRASDLHRFPCLRRRLDEVVGKFLLNSVGPAEKMIINLIEIEAISLLLMDYINSSHPKFIGGTEAVEQAMQQMRSSQDIVAIEKVSSAEKDQRSPAVIAKTILNGTLHNQESHLQSNNVKSALAGVNSSTRSWGIPSFFRSRPLSPEDSARVSISNGFRELNHPSSKIHLREPPSILRPVEMTEREAVEIIVTKLLLQSYYDIVRKNVQDLVPKAIMHFLVNRTKRDLHKTFIRKLYREELFEELFQEQDVIATKRQHAQEVFHILQHAVQTLDEVEYDLSYRSSNSHSSLDATTELPQIAANSMELHSRTNGQSRSFYSK
ncbi:hypothetical protein Tsubulata_022213 [Turnera subulata]|uniref:Dynamin-type G domain-containing protein n=1 Tax=Turnera subulata TaxID=218843 RepID=A0A9Q0JDV3_9ROSI|nr:hypothetical protein Tsubulata_022213 [Turnera subulata]